MKNVKDQFWALHAFFFIVLAMIGVLVLAAGLPTLELGDGLPFVSAEEGQARLPERTAQANTSAEGSLFPWLQGLLAFGLLLLLGMAVFLISVPKYRVWTRPVLKTGLVLFAALIFAALLKPGPGQGVSNPGGPVYSAPSFNVATSPLGDPPALLLVLVTTALLLLASFLGIWLFRQAFSPKQSASPLVQEAEMALAAIQAGTDFSAVIVRCYLRMNQVILEEQGLTRAETLTPREFETVLVTKGVPVEPLRALTQLFEEVRYGRKPVGLQAEQTAVASLTAIIQYCRSETVRQWQ